MTKIFLSFGANLGDKQRTIQNAINMIDENKFFHLIAQSSFYKSEALYNSDQSDFINTATQYDTELSPEDLLKYIHKVENTFGRVRTQNVKYEARTLDIDIIFYGNEQIFMDNLQIPHPEYEKRKFVLLPLAEINLNYRVPKNEKTIGELLELCPDTSKIERL